MINIGDVAWADDRAWQLVNSKDKAAFWSWNPWLNEPSWACISELYSYEDFAWLVREGNPGVSFDRPHPATIERVPE